MSGSSHPVSELTRQRVLSAADRLAFEPNRLARALVTARSQTVGVIVHDISDPYFGDIVKGLEDGLQADDYRLFVASSMRDPEKELDYVRAFQAHQVDAIVFAASSIADPSYTDAVRGLTRRFQARGGVVITLSDHVVDGPSVIFDNRSAVGEMVGYLAQRGHHEIGYIGGPPELEVSRIRLEGFTAAMTDRGMTVGQGHLAEGDFTFTGGSHAMAGLLAHAEMTAVVAANDLMAIGAMRHLQASGMVVPDDISVAGLDDIAIAEYGPVPLTTLRIPTYEIGRQGASILLEALGGGDPEDVSVAGEIIERESVRSLGSSG
jgi:LacI family transcriptional regulator